MDRKSIIADFSFDSLMSGLKMSEICRVNVASSGSVNVFVRVLLIPDSAFSGSIAAYCPDWTAANICVIEEQFKVGWPLKADKNRILAFEYSPSPVSVQKGIPAIEGSWLCLGALQKCIGMKSL